MSFRGSGTTRGYLAQPARAPGRVPGVVVIHENRGLNPYIEDVARRLATEGYAALAPDALAPVGGYPGDEDKARDLFAKLDASKRTEDLMAAFPYLKARPERRSVRRCSCNTRAPTSASMPGGLHTRPRSRPPM